MRQTQFRVHKLVKQNNHFRRVIGIAICFALSTAACTNRNGTPTPDGNANDDGDLDAAVPIDALQDVSTDDGKVDALVDAATQCPSDLPGADSDHDGVPDDQDCLPCDPQVNPNATGWHVFRCVRVRRSLLT